MQMDFWMGLFSGAIFGAGFMWLVTLPPYKARGQQVEAKQTRPLLQLVAGCMDNWPTGYGRVIQDEDGTVWACAGLGSRALFILTEIATDRATAVVTEAKWKAQRAQAQQKGPA
ncbi:MAG: hypothetical protein LBV56_17730 [Delftia acidovorans]|jgi:hypothetical protein|nr:hypothetical protein [Delftia acidovorans]